MNNLLRALVVFMLLPAVVLAQEPLLCEFEYTVQAGDSLSKIAAQFGTNYLVLADLNDLEDPYIVALGQVLIVPGGSGAPAPPAVEEEEQQRDEGEGAVDEQPGVAADEEVEKAIFLFNDGDTLTAGNAQSGQFFELELSAKEKLIEQFVANGVAIVVTNQRFAGIGTYSGGWRSLRRIAGVEQDISQNCLQQRHPRL